MDDKTVQALAPLVAKLNTTAEYVWGILLRQAWIEGVITLTILGGLVLFTLLLNSYINTKDWTDDSEGKDFAEVVGWVCGIVVTMLIAWFIRDAITAIVNPGYWALRQILTLVR